MVATLVGERRPGGSRVRSSGGVPVLDEDYHYLVRTTSVSDLRIQVLTAVGVPKVGITESALGNTICTAVTAERREDQRLLWDVVATFSSEVDERQSVQTVNGTPTEWVPIYETKFERLQEVSTKDSSGTAIANSAGQPFENGLMRSRFIPIWEFYQFEPATVTDETIIERNETVNDAEFKGRPTKSLLCTVLSSVIGFYYGSRLRFTRYALRYNEALWTQKRLDVGTVYLESGVHRAYTDDDGNVMLGALDGSGAKQTPGTPPAVLEFDMYPTSTFSDFLRL